MPFGTGGEFAGGGGGNQGGGGGAVNSVSAGDTSVLIPVTTGAVSVTTNTLDVIATDHPPAGNWSNNSHKITGLANATLATDAVAFGQLGASPYTITRITVSQTAGVNQIYICNGTLTLTLPAGTTGAWITYKLIAATSTLTITGTVDGVTNPTITQQYQSNTIVYDGTAWNNI